MKTAQYASSQGSLQFTVRHTRVQAVLFVLFAHSRRFICLDAQRSKNSAHSIRDFFRFYFENVNHFFGKVASLKMLL